MSIRIFSCRLGRLAAELAVVHQHENDVRARTTSWYGSKSNSRVALRLGSATSMLARPLALQRAHDLDRRRLAQVVHVCFERKPEAPDHGMLELVRTGLDTCSTTHSGL